jgi:hypothetical protein
MAATDLIDLFLYFLVKHKKRPNLKSCWQSPLVGENFFSFIFFSFEAQTAADPT